MSRTLVKIVDVCRSGDIEITFVRQLYQSGLIEIVVDQEEEFVDEDDLPQIEQYHTWHYDLEINFPGLEVARHLLTKIEQLQEELRILKSRY